MRVQAISGWATAAMFSIATFALAYLLDTLSPLVDVWAARRAGAGASVAGVVQALGWAVPALTLVLAVSSFVGWVAKARANVRVLSRQRTFLDRLPLGLWLVPVTNLVLPPLHLSDLAARSVGRGTRRRQSTVRLVWLWWATFVSALVAVAAGLSAGADNAAEMAGLRARVAAGEPVDVGLAVDLFGRQVVLRLPAAALFVVAAVLALLVIAKVTNAQYAKVAKLRGLHMATAVPLKSALRTTAADWTVELPRAALVDLLDADTATVLPAAALGGTIGT
jgi:hypothetical protein